MIIYNPHGNELIKSRLQEAERLLDQIPAKYCFITGSFIHKENYRDIDIFVISRSKKRFSVDSKKAKITAIDFNDLHSLFYHSISKSCIAKELLPKKPLKVTIADFWNVVNEAVPTLLNRKDKYHKDIRFLVLYTEYLNDGIILDTAGLDEKISRFKGYKDILEYITENVPKAIRKHLRASYLKRFFYTQAGYYKDVKDYPAQTFLYRLTHSITKNG